MAKGSSKEETRLSAKEVDDFERTVNQLVALHAEFAAQSKSKPDNALNAFKVKMLNEKIAAANGILAGVFKPFEGFDSFDEVQLPSNSDVSFVLTTYLASLERWRSANVEFRSGGIGWVWKTALTERIDARPPTRFKPEER